MATNGRTLLNSYLAGKIKSLNFRTDNAIKNHFYSKLRKFIRKILKNINKDNLLKSHGIDPNKYNSDKIYKMIKKFKIPYNTLTKESILTMILNFEKNAKVGKVENTFLKNKTLRKKTKEKENLYSEKINKRSQRKSKAKESFSNIYLPQRRSTRAQRTRRRKENIEDENIYETRNSKIYYLFLGASRMKRDFQQDIDYISSLSNKDENMSEVEENNGDTNFNNGSNNLNIIIDKSILFNNYVKEEEERSRSLSGVPSSNKSENPEFVFTENTYPLPVINNTNTILKDYDFANSNLTLFNKNIFDYYMVEYPQPLVSPINSRAQLYPMSTKNHFNIDLMMNPYDFASFPKNPGSSLRSPICVEKYINKEVNMQNKILINEVDNKDTLTPRFKKEDDFFTDIDTTNKHSEDMAFERRPSKNGKLLSLDMDEVNKIDTNKFYTESITSYENNNNKDNKLETPENAVTESDMGVGGVQAQGQISAAPLTDDSKKSSQMPISPNNIRTSFSISPKSAFVMTPWK
jgi:hypothetical protein